MSQEEEKRSVLAIVPAAPGWNVLETMPGGGDRPDSFARLAVIAWIVHGESDITGETGWATPITAMGSAKDNTVVEEPGGQVHLMSFQSWDNAAAWFAWIQAEHDAKP